LNGKNRSVGRAPLPAARGVSLKGYLVFIYIYPPRRRTGELRKKGKLYIGV